MLFEVGKTTLELEVAGYEFPDLVVETNEWDPNWLKVSLTLQAGPDQFHRTHPSLTTLEVEGLARWFAEAKRHFHVFESWSLEHEERLRTSITFTEPNLAFELWSGVSPLLRVYLSHEFIPPFAAERMQHASVLSPTWLDFPVEAGLLARTERETRDWTSRFPVRGRR